MNRTDLVSRLSRRGSRPPARVPYRVLALAAAAQYGVPHPWWAAMTVWLVVQPTRGLLLARSLARLSGTACGAMAGAVILYTLEHRPLPSMFALASWLALCAGLGSIFPHFRNYAFVLAGYTAAIVVLFGLGDGSFDPGLALDRVVCTIIGIACSTVASLHGNPAGGGRERERCSDASADPVIAESSALDRPRDAAAGGSSEGGYAGRWRRAGVVVFGALSPEFDISCALRAAARPAIALGIAIAIWWSTAWQAGAMMAMTAAVFASLFSSHDRGNEMLAHVLIGSVLGALAGIVCRLFVLPYAHGLLPTLLCIAPFLLVGAWLMRQPATVKLAVDFNMTFLLLVQPLAAPPAAAGVVLNEAAAILAGVLAATASFWLILPASSRAPPPAAGVAPRRFEIARWASLRN
jgi:uncharacterized membrane protein YccC